MLHESILCTNQIIIRRRSLLIGAAACGALALVGGCAPITATPGAGKAVKASAARLFINGAIHVDATRAVTDLLVSDGVCAGAGCQASVESSNAPARKARTPGFWLWHRDSL